MIEGEIYAHGATAVSTYAALTAAGATTPPFEGEGWIYRLTLSWLEDGKLRETTRFFGVYASDEEAQRIGRALMEKILGHLQTCLGGVVEDVVRN